GSGDMGDGGALRGAVAVEEQGTAVAPRLGGGGEGVQELGLAAFAGVAPGDDKVKDCVPGGTAVGHRCIRAGIPRGNGAHPEGGRGTVLTVIPRGAGGTSRTGRAVYLCTTLDFPLC